MAPIITMLTDFGYRDGYVGVMKGVIAGICPAAQMIDVTHNIPAQNLAAARFTLLNTYTYFPDGTIHLVVVDPGVGTDRRAIALSINQHYFVGPDNGVLSGCLDRGSDLQAAALTNPTYWRTPAPSHTFHGRDIFAAAAAHLAAGIPLHQLGEAIAPATLLRMPIPPCRRLPGGTLGSIQHVDHFGNIITTLPAPELATASHVLIGAVEVPIGQTYGEVEIGYAIALGGSHGWVEIAVNGSNAQVRFQVGIGDEVRLVQAQ